MLTNIQDISDEVLLRVISEGGDVDWKFFALKVMVSRLKLKLGLADEDVRKQCCDEMRELLRKSRSVPNAKKDVAYIMERFC